MRIEYKNTFRDLFRYQISHQFLHPVYQGLFLLCTGFIFFDQYRLRNDLWQGFVLAVAFYLAMWALQIIFVLILLLLTKRRMLTTRHTIWLDAEGLHEETAFNRTVHFWNGGIHKIRRRGGCIAIYVTPMSAHIVPMRAFPTRLEAEQFESNVRAQSHAA
jgi:hypothetical protein